MNRADKVIVAQVIKEYLDAEPDAINASIAEAATGRLGKPVAKSDISIIRNEIGLGVFQQLDNKHYEDIERAYTAGWEDAMRSKN